MNNDFAEIICIKKKLIKAIAETFFEMDCFFLGQNICRPHFFAQFLFHHKSNGTRLLSPESECTSFRTT